MSCRQSRPQRFARRRKVLHKLRFWLLVESVWLVLKRHPTRPINCACRPQRPCEFHPLLVVCVENCQIWSGLLAVDRSVRVFARESPHLRRRDFYQSLSESVTLVKTYQSVVIYHLNLRLATRQTVLRVQTLLTGGSECHRELVILLGALLLLFELQVTNSEGKVFQAGL